MKRPLIFVCCLLLFATHTSLSRAHTEFSKALKNEYKFGFVSCYTCHSRKAAVPQDQQELYKKNARAFRNVVGKTFEKHLAGKGITKRLADVKELKADNPKKVKVVEDVTKEFLEALKKVKAEKSPTGVTYGELLEKGTLDGVKPR